MPVLVEWEAGWAPEPVWAFWKRATYIPPAWCRNPDPHLLVGWSQLLYQLRYPDSLKLISRSIQRLASRIGRFTTEKCAESWLSRRIGLENSKKKEILVTSLEIEPRFIGRLTRRLRQHTGYNKNVVMDYRCRHLSKPSNSDNFCNF
jgi:hypothetical protein